MKNVKKWLSLSLAGAMLMGVLAGCGGDSTEPSAPAETGAAETTGEPAAPVEGGILRFGTDSEPTGFDPHTVSEEASLRVINQLYETLVSTNADMTFYGELAESWEIPDDVTYIFYLRQGVKFHSGREMTAEDVVYSFNRVLGRTEAGDIGALGSSSSYYGGIASVEATDTYTVKFTLEAPNAAFLNALSNNYGAIVDKDVIDENGDLMRADGGTGPFQLVDWLPDNYVELAKFEDYWEADRVQLGGITYYLIGDESARLAALRTGEIDIANLSSTNVTAAEAEENLSVLGYQTNDYIAVGCNLSTPTTDGSFSVYDDLKKKLMDAGIPEEEIAFIHTADSEAKKKELFSKVRAGQVRVLLGSTAKMGAGTNVQDKLIALHDLDCPWRPSDLQQRLGRIVRQGNENEEVEIYRYVTEGTFLRHGGGWQTLW